MPTQVLKDMVVDSDTGKRISADEARMKIKSAVAAGDIDVIQRVIDNGAFKRKIHKVAEVDTESSQITFVVSADNVDRDGERILSDALKKDFAYYESNPVALFNHDHSIPAVAKMVSHDFQDDKVVMTDQFATDIDYPFAKMLWELYAKGYMCMTSVGFIPLAATDDTEQKLEGQTGYTFTRIEMIEHSYVNVGANRHAVSQLPEKIRNDATLKSVYEEMVETPVATNIGDTNVLEGYFSDNRKKPLPILLDPDVSKSTFQIPNEFGGNYPLVLNVTIPPEKEVTETMKNEKKCPACETETDKTQSTYRVEIAGVDVTKDLLSVPTQESMDGDTPDFAMTLKNDDGKYNGGQAGNFWESNHLKRLGLQEPVRVFEDTQIGEETQSQLLFSGSVVRNGLRTDNGDAQLVCLSDAANKDAETATKGVSTPETKAKASVVKKMYGAIPGTYEHRQSIIRRGLTDYLDENLEMEDEDDDYYYMDFDVIGTTEKDVVVYCWNTSEHYKMDYMITDNTATFSNLMKVMPEVSYTPIEDEPME